MFNVFREIIDKTLQLKDINLNDISPTVVQKVKEETFLTKFINETRVAGRKCEFYANNAHDKEIANLFSSEADKLQRTADELDLFYKKMTEE